MQKKLVSLLVLMVFSVVSVTGILAFFLPFQINLIGLHSLMGFLFLVIIGFHVYNNRNSLWLYLKSKTSLVCLLFTSLIGAFIFLQPAPVQAILKLSQNSGPLLDRFEIKEDSVEYTYSPLEDYRLNLKIKKGAQFSADCNLAVWVENQSSYHIKTLYASEDTGKNNLPYWFWKHSEYRKAKKEAEDQHSVDAVTSATPNSSFDAVDYIIPQNQSFTVLVEIDLKGDGEPSLLYSVNVDNAKPAFYQAMTRLGTPQKDSSAEKEEWLINYNTENLSTALELIDSAILIIERR